MESVAKPGNNQVADLLIAIPTIVYASAITESA